MGYVRSDCEVDARYSDTSSNKFKFPKRFLEDTSASHLTYVPRKVRSAIKKRCCTSIFPDLPASKKLNGQTDGVKFHGKNGLTKSSLNLKENNNKNYSNDDDASLPLSKDEEEVAQALFALAGVISNSYPRCSSEQPEDKSSAVPETGDYKPTLEGLEEPVAPEAEVEPKATHETPAESVLPSVGGPVSEVRRLPFHKDTRKPDISISKKLRSESIDDVLKVNINLPAVVSERMSCGSDVSASGTDLNFQPGLNLQAHEERVENSNYPETIQKQTGGAWGLPEAQCLVMENRKIGSPFWPGLTSTIFCKGEGSHCAKVPARSYNSTSPEEKVSGSGTKDGQVVGHSRKWKRCLTHVYISHYVRDSQAAGKTIGRPTHSSKTVEAFSGTPGNHQASSRSTLLEVGLSGGPASPSPEKIAAEIRNAVLLHKRLVQCGQQASTTSYIGQKQSLDHLSLPTGYGVGASNATNRAGQGQGSLSHLFPFLQSSQCQQAFPFPLLQNYYASTSFSPRASAVAVEQVQMPIYVGSTSHGLAQMGLSPSPAPQLELQQQHLQKKTPTLLASQKSGVNVPYIPVNWQDGVVNISPMFHQIQNPFHPSCSSVDSIGTKYAPIFLR